MNNAFISYSHSADEKLSQMLQYALEKFAKPWYKVRNLNIFRDNSSLTVSPHLWTSIQNALSDSKYFIYMASPQAAASKWVQKEIKFWMDNKSIDSFIIVVTDGSLKWSDEKKSFLKTDDCCLPEFLLNEFAEEPLYVDMRNLRKQDEPSLNNIPFKNEVLKIAAKLHNKEPKDLAGDEITEHRKTIKLRNAAIFTLSILILLAAGGAWMANKKSAEALKEKNTAQANYLISEAQREVAIDPTSALKLAIVAMKKNNDSFLIGITNKIYRENLFYKIIVSEEFSTANKFASFSCMDVSPDGNSFIVGSRDHSVRTYDLSGKLLHEFKGHKEAITTIDYSPDGQLIATGSADGDIKLWDIKGKILYEYKTDHEAYSLNFSQDGNLLLLVSFFKARLLDLNLNIVHEYPNEDVISAAFSTDNKTILLAGVQTVKLIDYQGKQLKVYNAPEALENVFSPDGKLIVTGLIDSTLQLWNIDGNLIKAFKLPGAVNSVAFSREGSMFVATTDNGRVMLYDTEGNFLQELKGHKYGALARFLPDAKSMLTVGDGSVRLWSLYDLPLKQFLHNAHVSSVDFSRDGKILTGSWDNMARIWTNDGKLLSEFKTGVNEFVSSAKFSPSGNLIIIVSPNSLSIYDLHWKLINKLSYVGISSATFSPDSKNILVCLGDSTAKLFDLNGKLIHQFTHKSKLSSACFSPDGNLVFIGMENGTAYLWNMKGDIIQEFKAYNYIPCVAFSPDGKSVATAGTDFIVTLWSLQGKLLREFKGHAFRINAMAFSPDGKFLFTCSSDNTAKIWNMEGDIIREIKESGNISSIAVSPDGKFFLTGSMNYFVKLWNVPKTLSEYLNSKELGELSDKQKKFYNIN